jgi:hypothetical protein
MEGVIPNSRVVINPPALDQNTSWKRELFLRPGKWIPWVTLTVFVATIVLAIIVFVLHLNEKVCCIRLFFVRTILNALASPCRERMSSKGGERLTISTSMHYERQHIFATIILCILNRLWRLV